MTTRLALYARVSTADQTADPQLHALREFAAARGHNVQEEYVDVVSGAKQRRPALDRLMADARRRRFDAVACVKLDRLARSVHHLTVLAQEFEALGVDLVAIDQALDTGTPTGRLTFHVLGAIAEFERDLIRERTRAGLAAARRRGKRLGRPRALTPAQVVRARRLLRLGRSRREVAALLGCSPSTVARAGACEASLSVAHRAAVAPAPAP